MQSRRPEAIEIAAHLHQLLAAATTADLPFGPGLTIDRAQELVREVRAGRDSR